MVIRVASRRAASIPTPVTTAQPSASSKPISRSSGLTGGSFPVARVHANVMSFRDSIEVSGHGQWRLTAYKGFVVDFLMGGVSAAVSVSSTSGD